MSPASNRQKGTLGEAIAVNFLKQNGYEVIEQNYYYRHGEIDIIAKEQDALVFVEVKSRKSAKFGAPEEFVTPKKQELLRRTAEGYMIERNIGEANCRFDVVAIILKEGKAECNVFRDCF
jgi:putative endonuclease